MLDVVSSVTGAAAEKAPLAALPPSEAARAMLLSGDAAGAERILRPLLRQAPDAALSYLLGQALARQGRPMDALPHLLDALQADATRAEHWRDFVAALLDAGMPDAARQALGQAVQLGLPRADAGALEILLRIRETSGAPRDDAPEEVWAPPPPEAGPPPLPPALLAEARRLLDLFAKGRHARVAARARIIAKRWPQHVAGHEFLAAALEAMGEVEQALPPARRVVSLSPGDIGARLRLDRLIARRRGEEVADATQVFGQAKLPAHAQGAAALWRQANALHREGRIAEAIEAYREANRLAPDVAELKHALAALLQATGRLEECSRLLAEAVALKPTSLHLRQAHAGVLLQRLKYPEAAMAYREALELDPENGESLAGLANATKVTGQLAEAEQLARRAIEYGDDSVTVHSTLGHILQLQGRTEEALASFRLALAREPNEVVAGSGQLFCETHSGHRTPQELFEAHRGYGERLERRIQPIRHDRRLRRHAGPPRIGFVSGDLRSHAVSHFIVPFLKELHTRGFEMHAYSSHPTEDHVTRFIRPVFRGWTAAHGMTDADLAAAVQADRVDILFDLSGHTAHHRLSLFAMRPAPVQASWIGYPATTGLRRMDYLLANAVSVPPELDGQFTEAVVRLPFSTVFHPLRTDPPVAPPPVTRNGHVTFGSFNRLSKVTQDVLALWAEILRAAPSARLMMAAVPDAATRDRLLASFAALGVEPARIEIEFRTGLDRYLDLHGRVDLLLDTFPYAGGTSTCFAAWMGVPTLTLAGETMQARFGASLNAHLGLHDLNADSAETYRDTALAWAARPHALARLRAGLRQRVMDRLADPRRVADGLEVALHTMWQRWCHGLPAESFAVELEDGSILDPDAALLANDR